MMKFKDFAPDDEAAGFITVLFDSLLEELKRLCEVKDRGRLSLSMYHDSLNSPVCLRFSAPAELTSSKLLMAIASTMQTMRETFDITDGKVTIHMAYVVPPWEEDNNHH